jgi:hypothetical protein
MRVARCAACHQQIVQVTTISNLTMWIDADPSPDGTIIVQDGIGIVASANDAGYKHRPHRSSCSRRHPSPSAASGKAPAHTKSQEPPL